MEWLIMPSNNLRVTASKMGFMKDGEYVIGDECEASLEELLHNLQQEDTVSRSVRREIANSKLVEGDLFPILKAAVNDLTISHLVIRVLSNLTLPMAVIMPVKHQMTPKDWEKRRGVQHMESAIKRLCADGTVTNILVNHMKNNLEDAGEYTMEKTYVGMILEIISLIRNVLHADDVRPGSTNGDAIISNLIDAGFDDVVVDLVARDEGVVWVPSITQVLGLMFRSQKSDQLFELLVEKDTSTNKSDQVNNQSTPHTSGVDKKDVENEQDVQNGQDQPNEQGPKLPGIHGYEDDAAVESSHEGRDERHQENPSAEIDSDLKPEDTQNQQETKSDSGASDPISENPLVSSLNSSLSSLCEAKSENGSVSSEGSSITPLCDALQEVAQVRNSDSSRSATPTNDINDNASSSGCMSSVCSTSTFDGEDALREFRKKLSQFALKFAKKGLDRCILLCQMDLLKGLEDMCFLWVQNFFLPFASHPSVTYGDIRHIVSSAVISNLTYLACQTWQQFKMATGKNCRKKVQSNGIFKKLYLVMAVLKQILTQLRRYSEETLAEEEQKWFLAATETVCCTTNLRLLYPMLIGLFQPQNETTQYLRDLIHGNGELLRLFSNVSEKHMENGEEVMLQHFTDFVDSNVIRAYNHLLSSFAQNSLAENEAVFTFFYHIIMDLNAVHLLFQIPVFTNFANIWDAQNPPVSQESLELMDYIIFKYTEMAMENPEDGLDITKEVYGQKRKIQKGKKRKHSESEAGTSSKKSKLEVLSKMLNNNQDIRGLYCIGSSTDSSDTESVNSIKECEGPSYKTTQDCLEELRSKGHATQIEGLQTLLLEVCYVKLNCPKSYPAEPIVWQYCADKKSVPLFAFTLKDKMVQSLKVFKELLQKMGLHQAKDSSHLFPSVPAFMTPEMTFALAKSLGPLDKSMLKFDVSDDLELLPEHLAYTGILQFTGMDDEASSSEGDGYDPPIRSLRPTHSLQAPGGMWMGLIKKVNSGISTIIK